MKSLLKQYRDKKGITQSELANIVCCTEKHISEIECKRSVASPDLCKKLAKALDIDDWTELLRSFHDDNAQGA